MLHTTTQVLRGHDYLSYIKYMHIKGSKFEKDKGIIDESIVHIGVQYILHMYALYNISDQN